MHSMRLLINAANPAWFPRDDSARNLAGLFESGLFSLGIHGIMKHVLFVINPED
jgi:hypothetical protein